MLSEAGFYRQIIDHLQDGIYFVNTERQIMLWNHAAEEISGYTAEEITGKYCQNSGLNHIDTQGRPLCTLHCPLVATLSDGHQRHHHVLLRHKDGFRIPIRVDIFPIYRDKEIVGAVEIFARSSPTVFEDDLVDKLSSMVMHDELTQLPNRRYLESFLSYRLDEYKRFGCLFCVLFADVDDFSQVNNTYGHDAGDIVLKNIASSFHKDIRHNDLVGRWGGEEFLGVYVVSNAAECSLLAERFRSLVERTESVYGEHTIKATISVGVAIVTDNDTARSLVERADHLMYQSKRSGKNRVTVDSVL